jgi:glycosyltransferase involved in cell wall biosynthesis
MAPRAEPDTDRSAGDRKPFLTVAIPCYNEEAIVEASYRRLKEACEAQGVEYEIIFGDDGSLDRTRELIEGLDAEDPHVRLTSHFPNRGAGFTYREMWAAARGDVIVHMDADLAMPADVALPALLAALRDGAQVAVGSRYAGIKADYPLKRRIFSRGYVILNRLLFNLKIVDTQTGFIGFDTAVLESINPRADGFEILVEFIAQANEAGFPVAEVGLPWIHDTSSGETEVWSESIKMLAGTLRVRRRFGRFRRDRRRSQGQAPSGPSRD